MSRVRAYHVFAGRDPVLSVEGRPGRLHSMAALPEGAVAPEHTFVHGVSLNPQHEHALRQLLLASSDFDDFLDRLVAAGYDVAANNGESPFHLGKPVRLRRATDNHLGGALWPSEGQLSTLRWQPEAGAEHYSAALATAYAPELLDALRRVLRESAELDDVTEALGDQGWTVVAAGS